MKEIDTSLKYFSLHKSFYAKLLQAQSIIWNRLVLLSSPTSGVCVNTLKIEKQNKASLKKLV